LPQEDPQPFPADPGGDLSCPPADAGQHAQIGRSADKDKPTVIALREIASGKVGVEILNRGQA
jgi:hypothetical protein